LFSISYCSASSLKNPIIDQFWFLKLRYAGANLASIFIKANSHFMLVYPFPNLTTERLLLRELSPDDAEEIFRLRTDDSVNELIDRAKALSVKDAEEFIRKILTVTANGDGLTWVITLTGETKLAGTVVYWNLEKEKQQAEIGYELLPEYRGKGIMAEALKKVIRFGFEELKFKTIMADVKAKNIKSIKLLEKLGFQLTGEATGEYLIYELKA